MAAENENITRLDERIKNIQQKQHDLEERIDAILAQHAEILQRIAVLDTKSARCVMESKGSQCLLDNINNLDKRLSAFEMATGQSKYRWNQFLTFVIQLAWVILAAWVLTKLNLQLPIVS